MASSREINENIIKKIIKKIFFLFGYKITRINNFNVRWNDFIAECSDSEKADLDKSIKLALCSRPNLWSIIQSLKYISKNKVDGDLVECGVFRGGSLALIAKYNRKLLLKKKIIGFDTFEEGFSNEILTKYDVTIKKQKLDFSDKPIKNFYPTTDDVKKNIQIFLDTVPENLILIKGDILKTLKDEKNIPNKISFLRLDTDLYSTTKIQLEVLYPRLVKGGVLHIDDYGFFPGVKKAVDDYFKDKNIWLHRVDLTCRIMIKNIN